MALNGVARCGPMSARGDPAPGDCGPTPAGSRAPPAQTAVRHTGTCVLRLFQQNPVHTRGYSLKSVATGISDVPVTRFQSRTRQATPQGCKGKTSPAATYCGPDRSRTPSPLRKSALSSRNGRIRLQAVCIRRNEAPVRSLSANRPSRQFAIVETGSGHFQFVERAVIEPRANKRYPEARLHALSEIEPRKQAAVENGFAQVYRTESGYHHAAFAEQALRKEGVRQVGI